MNIEHLIAQGNDFREKNLPQQALGCYAQAFVADPESVSAWNNYGNVIREMGYPERSIPFLQHAISLDPTHVTAKFNLAVSYLLMGDYNQGWAQYEHRWNFEHLAGSLPQFNSPRWNGENLQGKTILIVGEQGHGDCIQFSRFLFHLHSLGAQILFQTTAGLVPFFANSGIISWVGTYDQTSPEFDYWTPIMSIPRIIGLTVNNIPQHLSYLSAHQDMIDRWQQLLGPKKKMRVGLSWSGRRDTWLNRHKSVPFDKIINMIKQFPDYDWINLQIDVSAEEESQLQALGVITFPNSIENFNHTAGLIHHLDVVISVDTAISHLSGGMGRPTWIMLNNYAVDWRWLLNRDDSPWYPSVKLFRQPCMDDWDSVIQKISKWLTLFKV